MARESVFVIEIRANLFKFSRTTRNFFLPFFLALRRLRSRQVAPSLSILSSCYKFISNARGSPREEGGKEEKLERHRVLTHFIAAPLVSFLPLHLFSFHSCFFMQLLLLLLHERKPIRSWIQVFRGAVCREIYQGLAATATIPPISMRDETRVGGE